MNAVRTAIEHDLVRDLAKHGGLAGLRQHVLQNLVLRTVVRESHNTAVTQLAFNQTQPDLFNLVASTGSDQAAVYDDTHVGEYVGLVVQYTNAKTAHCKGGMLRCLAWVSCQGLVASPCEEAWLAVAGADSVIQIISVAESRVVQQLHGHTTDVIDLSSPRSFPGRLLSLSRGGSVRYWDVLHGQCLACIQTDANTVEISPCGTGFLSGSLAGCIHWCDLPQQATHPLPWPTVQDQHPVLAPPPPPLPGLQQQTGNGNGSSNDYIQGTPELLVSDPAIAGQQIDCIRFLSGNSFVAKTNAGCMCAWSIEQPTELPNSMSAATYHQASSPLSPRCSRLLWSVKVAAAQTHGGYATRILLTTTADGAYICCGNTVGSVFVYDSSNGAQVCQLSTDKVEAPVRACALSDGCRHVWVALGSGFIFRYEYAQPVRSAEEDNKDCQQATIDVTAVSKAA